MKKILFSTVLIVVISFLLFIYIDPYYRIRSADIEINNFESGTFYLSFYKKFYPNKKFDLLITKLIKDNMDIKSLSITVKFVYNNNLCQFKNVIEEKCSALKKIPMDSSWVVQISSKYKRIYKASIYLKDESLCSNLYKFQEKCK
jgi:hypothetical protein